MTRIIQQIDFQKSIQKRWLIYRESFLEKSDIFIHIFVTFMFGFCLLSILKGTKSFNENEKFFFTSVLSYFFVFRNYDLQKNNRKKIKSCSDKKHSKRK